MLREFSKKNLLASLRGTFTSRPLESAFQIEWYRAFTSLVGHGVGLSSEWSHSSDGRIDFRIHDQGWGVEILRDGDRLREHCQQFTSTGRYYDWIQKGLLRDWVILDCRHTTPKRYGMHCTAILLFSTKLTFRLDVMGTKLWRVIFKDDYSSAVVLDHQNNTKIPEFTLFDWTQYLRLRVTKHLLVWTETVCGFRVEFESKEKKREKRKKKKEKNNYTLHCRNKITWYIPPLQAHTILVSN